MIESSVTDDTLVDKAHPGPSSRVAIVAGGLLALALLSGSWSVLASHGSNTRIDRAKDTVIGLERLLSSVKDLETGLRGFILTGNDAYLAPYEAAVRHLEPEFQALQGLDVDLPKLKAMVEDRKSSAAATIAQYRTDGAGRSDRPRQNRRRQGRHGPVARLRCRSTGRRRRRDPVDPRPGPDRTLAVRVPGDRLHAGGFRHHRASCGAPPPRAGGIQCPSSRRSRPCPRGGWASSTRPCTFAT